MRPFRLLVFLVLGPALWTLAACEALAPVTGVPANPAGVASPEKSKISEEIPPPEDTISASNTGPNVTDDTTSSTFETRERVFAVNTEDGPMGSKTDGTGVQVLQSFYDYQARYGIDFSETAPKAPETATWPLEKDGSLNLRIRCETRLKELNVENIPDDFGWSSCRTGMKVWLIFTPEGGSASDSSIYDVAVSAVESDQANVVFPRLLLGLGHVDLQLYRPEKEVTEEFFKAHHLGSFTLSTHFEMIYHRYVLPTLLPKVTPEATRSIYQSEP